MKPALVDEADLRERATTRPFFESLVSLQRLLPQIDAAAVVDSNGEILANSRSFPPPRAPMRTAAFFVALKEDPNRGLVIAEPVLNPINHRWMLYFARAITDRQERFVGVVLMGIQVSYFEGYFSSIDLGPTSAITLIRGGGALIARWPRIDSAIGIKIPNLFSTVSSAGEQPYVGTFQGADNQSRRAAITPFSVQGNALFISVSQSRAALLQPWRNALIGIVVFAVMSLLVLAALAWFIWRAFRDEERWSGALIERETRLSLQAIELASARDAAEAANRVRGQFLANMSHELRTPLNAVLGFSEIMEKELFGPLGDARYREFAGDIHNSGKHLLDIIGSILDLAKIDAGKLELYEQEVDMVDVMQVCSRLMTDSAQSGGVKLIVHLPKSPVAMRADLTRMKQILLNLLSNAIKFTPAGKEVELTGEVGEQGFAWTVTDTGIGMTDEETQTAMQPFRQIDSSLARRYQGTGLGLPLTKSLVELHGGVLEIHSRLGQGTTVIVRFPKSRLVADALSPV
jgi:signal transduction histidine kinase